MVGKKVSVRIERVMNGTAYASLARWGSCGASREPITAEAQAEKPTRASRAKKPDHVPETEAEAEVVDVEPIDEEEVEDESPRRPSLKARPTPWRGRRPRNGRAGLPRWTRQKKPAVVPGGAEAAETPEPESRWPRRRSPTRGADEAAAEEAPTTDGPRRRRRGAAHAADAAASGPRQPERR